MTTTQETQEQSAPDTRNLYQRLAAASLQCGRIAKTGTADRNAGGFDFASHDDVADIVRRALISNGVMALSTVTRRGACELFEWGGKQKVFADVTVTTTFVNLDKPEEFHEVSADGWCWENRDKAIGAATSYATKYSFLKGLMLPTGEDTDAAPVDDTPAGPTRKELGAAIKEKAADLEIPFPDLMERVQARYGCDPKTLSVGELQYVLKNMEAEFSEAAEKEIAF